MGFPNGFKLLKKLQGTLDLLSVTHEDWSPTSFSRICAHTPTLCCWSGRRIVRIVSHRRRSASQHLQTPLCLSHGLRVNLRPSLKRIGTIGGCMALVCWHRSHLKTLGPHVILMESVSDGSIEINTRSPLELIL